MAQRVAAHRFDDARGCSRRLDRPVQRIRINMVAANNAGFWFRGELAGGKHELPAPLATRATILPRQRIGQPHVAVTRSEIALMQRAHAAKMRLQRRDQLLGQHRHSILAALAVAHQDLPVGEIQVLDAQHQHFNLPQPRPVQQTCHHPLRPRELGE